MDFEFSEEQALLRDSVGGYLLRHYAFEARREALAGLGWRPEIWRGLAEELGVLGAALPETVGGLGGGPVETMIICEELGKALALEPYLDCVVLGGALLRGGGAAAAALLPGVIDGSVRAAPALLEQDGRFALAAITCAARPAGGGWIVSGGKIAVAAAPHATHLLVSCRTGGASRDLGGISLVVVPLDAAGVRRRDHALIDGTRAADIYLENVEIGGDAFIGEPGEALPRIEAAVDTAIAALCAEAVGVMRIMLQSTIDFARARVQFGKPIAGFQVLRHRMVDMRTQIEQCISLTIMATLSLGLPDAERRRAVAAAKAFVSAALRSAAQAAVQIHGGMGTTDDLAISHYFKRATVIESRFGNAAHHLARMADDSASL